MELILAPIEVLRLRLTDAFEGWASRAAARSCALSGGSTALVFLGALKDCRVDWSRVSLFWVDERAVPPDHPDSNYGMANRVLLAPLGRRAPRAFRMPAEQPDLGGAAIDYDQVLARELKGGPLDLAILGVGEDGHIGSLFPGRPALMAEGRVVAVDDAPKPPPRRLSLTLAYLKQTRQIWVVVIGEQKRDVLQAAIGRTELGTPLDLLLSQAKDVTVFTDQNVRQT
ncbi:MAG: 6-phosphogluconolactonase [Betaproteobacteria bacterium]|nr:6-phosphogluconolactonase [Betaproteobacteria bacterium]MDE2001935.1 6-phosphogluconolactonase [Betaproteobacteria bacterium]MDE2209649.1 6-phosphogluconolactonase [Betaproteobacteria bacterium]MDE2358000.1 6-phosphogluconolactonase [Betaproteobacteria bacterium]